MYKYLTFLMLVLSTSAISSTYIPLPSDNDLHKLIVGTWVVDPKDEHANAGIGTYKSNGTLLFNAYQTSKCIKLRFQAFANWRVKNRKLYTKVITVNGKPSKISIEDEIISVSSEKMILKADSGLLQYRIKSGNCI